MSDLFRPAAVAHQRRGAGPGVPVVAAGRWVAPAFWALLGLALAALVAGSLLRVPTVEVLPATAGGNGTAVRAALPRRHAGAVRPGEEAAFIPARGRRRAVPVTITGVGRPAPGRGAVVVVARASAATPAGPGALEVTVGSRRALLELVGGLGGRDG